MFPSEQFVAEHPELESARVLSPEQEARSRVYHAAMGSVDRILPGAVSAMYAELPMDTTRDELVRDQFRSWRIDPGRLGSISRAREEIKAIYLELYEGDAEKARLALMLLGHVPSQKECLAKLNTLPRFRYLVDRLRGEIQHELMRNFHMSAEEANAHASHLVNAFLFQLWDSFSVEYGEVSRRDFIVEWSEYISKLDLPAGSDRRELFGVRRGVRRLLKGLYHSVSGSR